MSPEFDYQIFGQALFDALKLGLGSKFTEKQQASWNKYFDELHKAMTTNHFKGPNLKERRLKLSPQEITLVTDSWERAKKKWDEMGELLFRNFFDNEPLALQSFSFKDDPDLFESPQFKKHYDKVLKVIDDVVISLRIPYGDIFNELTNLGKAHKTLGVEKDTYKAFNRALFDTFDNVLDEHFAIDIRDSCQHLFDEIVDGMVGKLYEESDETIPEKERIRVVKSWRLVKELDQDIVGKALMKNIFTLAPEALKLYSFKNVSDLYESQELKRHYKKLLGALDNAILNLDDKPLVDKELNSLGFRHFSYGVKQSHYDVVNEAVLLTLETGLSEKFTPEIKNAWGEALNYMKEKMIGLNYEPSPHLTI